MSEILTERNAIINASATRLVELGSLAAQRLVEGKQPDYEDGKKILTLLRAFTMEAELSDDDVESLLYCLRKLSGAYDFPTVEPLVGKGITYVIAGAESSSGLPDPQANSVLWSDGSTWQVIPLSELWEKLMGI